MSNAAKRSSTDGSDGTKHIKTLVSVWMWRWGWVGGRGRRVDFLDCDTEEEVSCPARPEQYITIISFVWHIGYGGVA